MTAAQRFLERFRAFGAAPDPDRYEDLFDPDDGTVLHPGMLAPLHHDHVHAYMTAYLNAMSGFRFDIVSFAERDGVVFVEAKNEARPGGRTLRWDSVYRLVLRGERVLRGQAFADRVPILAALLPDTTLAAAADLGAPGPGITAHPTPAAAPSASA